MLFAADPGSSPSVHLILAAALAVAGFFCLLPRPQGRMVAIGIFLVLAAAVTAGMFLLKAFGTPSNDAIHSLLFWFFSAGAVTFATILVSQRNPARGALAFAFVILSVCGLFLLLAAPFLMAATIVVYAGAVIVTFLFVLMLSHAGGPSSENDRSREPLLGSLAGFAFAGLVLLTLQQSGPNAGPGDDPSQPVPPLPTPVLTGDERTALHDLLSQLDGLTHDGKTAKAIVESTDGPRERLTRDVLNRIEARLRFLDQPAAPPWDRILDRVTRVRNQSKAVENAIVLTPDDAKKATTDLTNELRLMLGSAELPARNVGTLGIILYSEHLLAVEMAGTLLLVATIGAVVIASRKGVPA